MILSCPVQMVYFVSIFVVVTRSTFLSSCYAEQKKPSVYTFDVVSMQFIFIFLYKNNDKKMTNCQ